MSGGGEVGVSPHLTGTGETALDFVVDEDGADFVAAGSERLEEYGVGDVDAAFALDGFDYDAAGFFGDKVGDRGAVVVGAVFESGNHRSERFLIFWVRGRAQAAHCAAVEGIVEADDFVFGAVGLSCSADFAGEFDGGFVGFAAGVADEDFGGVTHGAGVEGFLDEELGEGAGPGVVVEI